jgi:hypothetical protein
MSQYRRTTGVEGRAGSPLPAALRLHHSTTPVRP